MRKVQQEASSEIAEPTCRPLSLSPSPAVAAIGVGPCYHAAASRTNKDGHDGGPEGQPSGYLRLPSTAPSATTEGLADADAALADHARGRSHGQEDARACAATSPGHQD